MSSTADVAPPAHTPAPQQGSARHRPAAKAIVIRTAGTNCDTEMCEAFTVAGASVTLIHLDKLIAEPELLDSASLLGFPGGFSYGDDIASGRILAVRLKQHLWPKLHAAAARGCLMIAACNGFQVIVQAGLLPGLPIAKADADVRTTSTVPTIPRQEVSLQHNIGGRFIDTWLPMNYEPASACLWTKGIADQFAPADLPDVLTLPIAHGEGRFVTASPAVLDRLKAGGQVALRYATNVNGSEDAIAGICDPTGRIFGLMPHPERYLHWTRHPCWTRLRPELRKQETPGLMMFRSAVAAAVV